MKRRDLLKNFALGMGGMIISPSLASAFERFPEKSSLLTNSFESEMVPLLDEIAETIIPTTSTPGAKAAKVGEFIALVVKDCYKPTDAQKFWDGLNDFEQTCKKDYAKSFMDLGKQQRIEALTKAQTASKENKNPFFKEMKGLTMSGYFTSEIGCTQALAYVQIPGKYDGCAPMQANQKSWATTP